MATRTEKTTNYKQIFRLTLLVCLGLLVRWGYSYVSNVVISYDIKHVKKEVSDKEAKLASFSNKFGYDKLQYVKDLENNNKMMPRSDHINAIMEIFGDLLEVDKSDTFNIEFSNFEISLEKIKLDGHVMKLALLYESNSRKGLITRFEELSFLDNISIKTYERSDGELGYDFTLTANVTNNGK